MANTYSMITLNGFSIKISFFSKIIYFLKFISKPPYGRTRRKRGCPGGHPSTKCFNHHLFSMISADVFFNKFIWKTFDLMFWCSRARRFFENSRMQSSDMNFVERFHRKFRGSQYRRWHLVVMLQRRQVNGNTILNVIT